MDDFIEKSISYGKNMLKIKIPKANFFESLEMKSSKSIVNIEESLEKSLDNPIESKKIEEIAYTKKSVCIVVSDITRKVPNKIILDKLLQKLKNCKIKKENIKIIIATGSHRKNTKDEQAQILSGEIVENYTIYNHDCLEEGLNTNIGRTKNGGYVSINKHFVESDIKILTGVIQPHHWAGFSGGYKSICPGIASFDTIMLTHNPEILGHEKTTSGLISGNLFYEKTLEIGQMANPDFICNAVLDKEKNPIAFFSGNPFFAHSTGAEFCGKIVKLNYSNYAEIVIADGGGYPSDSILYQTVKAIHHAAKILKKGGTLILAAECIEGIGSDIFKKQLFEILNKEEYLKKLYSRKNYELDQWQLQEIISAATKGSILIYCTGINSKDFPFNLFEKIETIEEGIQKGLKKTGINSKISIIKDCPFVIPEVGA